jgi:P27 family predicted phage terminase small subunit
MRGDKAKPTGLRVLRMTGKEAEKLIRRQVSTPGPLADPPEWLTADQKAAWAYVIANAPRDILKRIDKSVVAGFVVAEDLHRQACLEISRSALLIKSPKQALPMQNPYLAIANRQFVLMQRAASELGFTPCSRARIEAGNPPAQQAGDWEDVASA